MLFELDDGERERERERERNGGGGEDKESREGWADWEADMCDIRMRM